MVCLPCLTFYIIYCYVLSCTALLTVIYCHVIPVYCLLDCNDVYCAVHILPCMCTFLQYFLVDYALFTILYYVLFCVVLYCLVDCSILSCNSCKLNCLLDCNDVYYAVYILPCLCTTQNCLVDSLACLLFYIMYCSGNIVQ